MSDEELDDVDLAIIEEIVNKIVVLKGIRFISWQYDETILSIRNLIREVFLNGRTRGRMSILGSIEEEV